MRTVPRSTTESHVEVAATARGPASAAESNKAAAQAPLRDTSDSAMSIPLDQPEEGNQIPVAGACQIAIGNGRFSFFASAQAGLRPQLPRWPRKRFVECVIPSVARDLFYATR
ncbi:MAG: hypothetical protein IT518_10630 [Burkholderiales bacterium]|nr:hypothetical protein [Burkholderiales bacterium]